jgi:hypothetical protein
MGICAMWLHNPVYMQSKLAGDTLVVEQQPMEFREFRELEK